MILMREKCTSSRSRDHHGLFFMNKQRMCVWARYSDQPEVGGILLEIGVLFLDLS